MRNATILISILSLTTSCIDAEQTTDETTSELDLFVGPPPNGPNVLRVSSSELYSAMFLSINGTKLSVDTTETAPPIAVPQTVCTWPNETSREAAQAECYADFSGSDLMACLQQVNVDYPNISECHQDWANRYSYVDFQPSGLTANLQDLTFIVDPIHKASSVSDIDIDIHYIHTDGNFISSAAFEGATPTTPAAVLTMPLTSPYPTLYCHRSLGCPDINMTNMKVTTRLTTITAGESMRCPNNAGTPPYACTQGAPISAKLGFGNVVPTYSFNRNLVGIPDFLITALIDVDATIKSAFESKIKAALETTSARAAINDVLTSIVLQKAQFTHPGLKGFARIRGTWFDAGSLVVQYDWY